MLARLVGFDTTSRNPDLELIGFVRAWLDQHGVPYRVSTDPSGAKANIRLLYHSEPADEKKEEETMDCRIQKRTK